MGQGWGNGILGIWLTITPFFVAYPEFYAWNNFIAGIIIGIPGLSMIDVKLWQGWLFFWLGIWLIISSFIPGLHQGTGVYFNNIICGIIAMTTAFGAYLVHRV
jgi:hypothetical protein